MNPEPFSSLDVSRRRRHSGWRQRTYESVREISPEVAEGLFTHFNNGRLIRTAQVTLKTLDPSAQKAIWDAAYPGIAPVVEIAWQHLSGQTIARRDGGTGGHGEPFTWPLTAQEADDFKIEWLRKLLIVVGPFPELGLPDVIRHLGQIAVGRMEESDGDYFKETTGHHYDSDAPAYVAAALLSHMPDSEMAREIVTIFERQLLGQAPHGSDRAVKTAWICADRPDLWEKLDTHLSNAGKEPGFQGSLLGSRIGGHPGAWLHLLQTIRDHELLRFDLINEWIRSTFNIDWQWKSHKRDDLQPWLDRWVAMHESAALRSEAFTGKDPGDFTLALWGEATTDGVSTLARIANPAALIPDFRLAAAHFLQACPAKHRASLVLELATDPDLRVANAAAPLLNGWRSPVSKPEDLEGRFARLCRFLDSLPAKLDLPTNPAPFPTRSPDFEAITFAIANSFPDGAEATIERLLPMMDTSAREAVVSRLNRYRLTEENRSLAKILHGDRPEDWENWLKDNQGSQLFAQRQLLLKMLGDRSMEVAEHAFKAVKNFTISSEEAALLRPLFASKSAKKHLFVTHLYAQQPPVLIGRLIPCLLHSKRGAERLAALEILRQLADSEPTADLAREIWKAENYQPLTPEERRATDVLENVFGNAQSTARADEPPSLENAFGLVNPAGLIAPLEPQDHDILLHSPVTEKIIHGLDQWLIDHVDVLMPTTQPELRRVQDISIPYISYGKSFEEKLACFPLATDLAEWWDKRPADMRDPDGFELIRLALVLKNADGKIQSLQIILFGLEGDILTKSRKYQLDKLIEWIRLLRPGEEEKKDWRSYLIDATEAVYFRLCEKQKNGAGYWQNLVVERLMRKDDCPDAILRRIWNLGRCREEFDGKPFGCGVMDIARFYQRGIATEDEIIWGLVGPRKFKDKYDQERAFRDLATATQPPGGFLRTMSSPAYRAVIQRVCDRIVALELGRGEVPEVWSHAAKAIKRIQGASYLQRFLTALGSLPLTRKRGSSGNAPDLTRPAVLIHLISVCHPAESDTADEFSRLMNGANISVDRLLEIAIFRPTWTEFIEHATGIKGLRDAVSWIFAHTRSTDYLWESQARELWAGELNFQTAITPDEFIAGAVDPDWFARVHSAVGDDVWNKLYAAAKFASTGRGHTRARLFADALLDKISVAELRKLLEDGGNLDAALAIGLPALPSTKKARLAELLRRYEILQALKHRSKKSKAQRAASEQNAFEIGVRNLARRAGFTDTLRFEWAMETEAVADLGALEAEIDGLLLAVQITPAGVLELHVSRDGKPVATIPAAVKKNTAFTALRDRMAGLKQQASRLRPALEDLMVRRVSLTSSEWQRLIPHPLAGPLIKRLVLAADAEILGFPDASGLRGLKGEMTPWPADSKEIHIAHPVDLLPADRWHQWHREIFDQQIVQPFKQVFRELYLATESEKSSVHGTVDRFQNPRLITQKLLAILTKRGWIFHPEHGLHRLFRNEEITAWISFDEYFHHSGECPEVHLNQVSFTSTKPFKNLPVSAIPPRIFSEVLRDVDLIVSVAHASGANPETTLSTIESRAALVRETCHLLGIANVTIDGRHVVITGKLGNYRIHLDSGIVHRVPGAMIPVISDPQTERGRIFLPFADDDVLGVDCLSRVLLFANDESIRDPRLARILRPV
jgi:hypothetical protein